ncbi:hypothetical protein HDU85_004944 [Gaertneriomyces sp. JEL0708]|nr:hypothetical protein HDU85_004944 [Gaertneriomyces sp. JEL0708]
MAPVDACVHYGDPFADSFWGGPLAFTCPLGEDEQESLVDDDADSITLDENVESDSPTRHDGGGKGLRRQASMSFEYIKLIMSSVTSLFTPSDSPTLNDQTTKQPDKKYVLQTAEFYGADFSAPPENPEIAELHHRSPLDELQLFEQTKAREQQGSVFISALNNIANLRSAEDAMEENEPPAAPPRPKVKLTEAVRQHAPAIDYSEVFPSEIGEEDGVYVFRIESLFPVLMDADSNGRFCVADCYIILNSQSRDDQYYDNDTAANLDHKIYVWIGDEAEVDKRFCAAMYSTGLRNWLAVKENVDRETPDDESKDFLDLFGGKITHEDASAATESGLFVAKEKRYPLRMYMLYGGRDVKIRLVDPSYWSLKSSVVFLLDWGLEMYQWNGRDARLNHKAKCRMLVDRINRLERVGRASVMELDEGSETPRFWDILGGERTASEQGADEAEEGTDEFEYRMIGEAPAILYRAFNEINSDLDAHIVAKGRFRRALLASDGAYILDAGVELFMWIGKAASSSVRAAATELLARVVPLQKRPKWLGLDRLAEDHESEVFKMRFPDWDKADKDLNWLDIKEQAALGRLKSKSKAAGIQVDVRALYAPAPSHTLSTTVEDALTHANALLHSFSAFVYQRGRFVELPKSECGHFFTDDAYVFLCVYRLEEERERARREERERRRVERKKQGIKIESATTAMSIDRTFRDGYHLPSPSPSIKSGEESDEGNSFDTLEPSVECVVYFWQGRHASRLAYSTFKFKTQHEMENLMQDMYGCSVRVVTLDQQKEPIALLAHLGNSVVLHRGSRTRWLAKKEGRSLAPEGEPAWTRSRMYHIKTDSRYKTTRAAEVLPKKGNLVSRDCFFVYSQVDGIPSFLWRGKGASKEEARKADTIVRQILAFYGDDNVEITTNESMDEASSPGGASPLSAAASTSWQMAPQNLEPNGFMMLLQPPHERYYDGTEYYYVPPPRFLRCSCSQGYFQIEEVVYWQQTDLQSDSCVIVDPGAPRKLWVWVGRGASDVVRKLCRKSVEVWLERLDDGRVCGRIPAIFGQPSTSRLEPAMSEVSSYDDVPGSNWLSHDTLGGGSWRTRSGVSVLNSMESLAADGSGYLGTEGVSSTNLLGEPSSPTPTRSMKRAAKKAAEQAIKTRLYEGYHSEEPDADVGDVVWVVEGDEPGEFTSYFCGWDEREVKGTGEIGNAFVNVANAKRKEAQRRQMLEQQQQQRQRHDGSQHGGEDLGSSKSQHPPRSSQQQEALVTRRVTVHV